MRLIWVMLKIYIDIQYRNLLENSHLENRERDGRIIFLEGFSITGIGPLSFPTTLLVQ